SLPEITAAQFEDAEFRRRWSGELEQHLKQLNGSGQGYRVHSQPSAENVDASVLVTREHHGTLTTKTSHPRFFRPPDYPRLAAHRSTAGSRQSARRSRT